MKLLLWLLALSGYVITAHCHLQTIVANPGGIGGIFKGPDSETIVKGPDGSVITSEQRGGIIQTEQRLAPIIVAEPEVLEVGYPLSQTLVEDGYNAPLGPSETLVQYQSPIGDGHISPLVNSGTVIAATSPYQPSGPTLVAPLEPTIQETLVPAVQSVTPVSLGHTVDIVEQDPHIIETKIIPAPAVEPKESTDLVGPSGSISTRGSESIVSGPASTTITRTAKILVAPPVISGIPLASSVLAPIHPPPLVEVNNEIPLASPLPSISSSVGPLISSTVSPLNLQGLSVSTGNPHIVSPVVSTNAIYSTLTPPLVRQDVPLLTNLRSGLGSTIAPPTVQQPVHFVPTQSVNFSPTVNPNLSSNFLPPPEENSRPIFATGLLTGEQYDDVRPGLVSRITPPNGHLLRQTVPVVSTTVSPLSDQHHSQVLVSTGTPGVSIEDEGASGYVQPALSYGGVQSSTVLPISSTAVPPSYNQDYLINRQLTINPAGIPSRNIVPPEIGYPRGAIDLGSTVSSVTREESRIPIAPGLHSSPNLQGIDSDNIQRVDNDAAIYENNLQNGYYRNEILLGNNPNVLYHQSSNVPLLSNTNPVVNGYGIPQREVIEAELRQQQVDVSQIQFTNSPLSDVGSLPTGAGAGLQHEHDDRVAENLWNRYGRKIRDRKY